MDIGSIGFSVSTDGPKQLADSLDQTTQSAKSLNTALDSTSTSSAAAGDRMTRLAAQTDATNAAIAKQYASMGTGTSAANAYNAALGDQVNKLLSLGQTTQAIDLVQQKTGMSYAQSNAAIKDVVAARQLDNTAATASSGILSTLANMLGFTGGAITDQATKTRASAAEHVAHSAATTELREAMHTLEPELSALGIGMQNMTQFGGAARAGMLAFAAAVAGTFVVEMAKADDVIQTTSVRLNGLAGVKMGTQLHDGLVDLSTDIGKVAFGLEPAIESITKLGQEMASNQSVIYVGGLDGISLKAADVTGALGALFEKMRMGGADETQATQGINSFFASVQKAGGITGDALSELAKVAPQAVNDIVKSITNGTESVTQFEAALNKTPLSINALIAVLSRMRQATDDAFQVWRDNPKTVADAVNNLKVSFDAMWKSMSDGNDFSTSVINTIKLVTSALQALPEWLKSNSISDAINAWLNSTSIADVVTTWTKDNITDPFSNWLNSTTITDALNQYVLKPIQDWLQSTSIADAVRAWAQANIVAPITAAVQAAAAAIASITKGGGGNPASAGGGNPGTTDALGNSSPGSTGGDTSISSGSSTDIGSGGSSVPTDTGSAPADFSGVLNTMSFATGGGFTVGGDGGTDTTPVGFMATKGEHVDIYHGDKPSGGDDSGSGAFAPAGQPILGDTSQMVDLLSAHMSEDFTQQTSAIDSAINNAATSITEAVNNSNLLLTQISNNTVNGSGAGSGTSSGASTTGTTGTTPTTPTTPATSTTPPPAGGGASGFTTQSGQGMGDQAAAAAKAADAQEAKDQAAANAAQQQFDQQQAAAAAKQDAAQAAKVAKERKALQDKRDAQQAAMNAEPSDYGVPASSGVPPPPVFSPTGTGMPGSPFQGPPAPLPGEQGSPFEGPIAPTTPGESGSRFFGPQAPPPGEAGSPFEGPAAPGLSDLKASTDKTNDRLTDANKTLDDISKSSDQQTTDSTQQAQQTQQSVDQGAQQTSQTIDQTASQTSQSIDQGAQQGSSATQTAGSGIEQATTTAGTGIESAISSGLSALGEMIAAHNGSQQQQQAQVKDQQQKQQQQDQQTSDNSTGASGFGNDNGFNENSGGSVFDTGTAPFNDFGGGGSSFGGGGFDSGGGGVFDTGTTGFNDFGLGGGGTAPAFDFSGSSAFDSASSFMDSGGSSFGGGDASAGDFATGGSFVVGGDGGTDTTRVMFMATKGERVTIEPPPGIPGSGSSFHAGSFATGGAFTVPGSGSSSTVTINPASLPGATSPGTKTVNIIVQQGVQADQFIASRAQVQRAAAG